MRLTTIWTLPAMSLRERLRRTRELATIRAAQHLPRRLHYWAVIVAGNDHMVRHPEAIAGEMTIFDVLDGMPGGPK